MGVWEPIGTEASVWVYVRQPRQKFSYILTVVQVTRVGPGGVVEDLMSLFEGWLHGRR